MPPLFPHPKAVRPPWTWPFIEISLRALRQLHYDSLPSELPIFPDVVLDSHRLNVGVGVGALDERTVCSAIFRQIAESTFIRGAVIGGSASFQIAAGNRHYRVMQEAVYPTQKTQHVDLRIDLIDQVTRLPIRRPAFIEAKRARFYKSGRPVREQVQKQAIAQDVLKLRELEKGYGDLYESPRGYVVVWDVTSSVGEDVTEPISYLSGCLDDECIVWQVRWAPLVPVDRHAPSMPACGSAVDQWLWVVLAEVTTVEPTALSMPSV